MEYEEAVALLGAPGGPFEVVSERLMGRDMPVFAMRERSLREKIANAAVHGDKECIVYEDRRITYKQFVELVWGAGHALVDEFGLKKGDRIGILAFNQPDWLISLFGAASVGGIGVGLNGWWTTPELEYGLADSGCRFLIVDEHLYERVEPILSLLPALERVFYIGEHPPAGTTSIRNLLKPRSDMPTVPIAEDDPFVILYTSGTTGRSKGCITTHCGTIAQVTGIVYRILLTALLDVDPEMGAEEVAAQAAEQKSTLLTSPLFHVAGLHSTVCTSLTVGARLIFGSARFNAKETLALMEREKVTTWMAIPTLLQRLVEHPDVSKYDLSTLQGISTGGAPAAPELAAKAREVLQTKVSLSTTYGLTECHGMAASIAGAEYQARPNSVGRPIPVMQVKIIDPTGNPLPTGEAGEILLSGPTITPGYWGREEETRKTIRDGWLHTGDVGYVDEAGYIYISDRAKDMILRGGENVYCVEIENCLQEHPDIEEAAIIGVPDKDLGERVKAIVRPRAASHLTAMAVQDHVASRLAKFKVPSEVEFIDRPLPRNPAGKVMKNLLRDGDTSPQLTEHL